MWTGKRGGNVGKKSDEFTALDKIEEVINDLQKTYPTGKFIAGNIPPFTNLDDNSFDYIVSFQVIEHIKDDVLFLKEIYRVLKPGGTAILTTPNRIKTLTRNPWHIREYTADELTQLAKTLFSNVEMKGISGNEKIWEYYNRNMESVKKFTKWDILDLQYRLPNWMLRIPYDIMNRLNRNSLQEAADDLVKSISHEDYLLTEDAKEALDLYLVVRK